MDNTNKVIIDGVLTVAFDSAESLGISSYDELKDYLYEFLVNNGYCIYRFPVD